MFLEKKAKRNHTVTRKSGSYLPIPVSLAIALNGLRSGNFWEHQFVCDVGRGTPELHRCHQTR